METNLLGYILSEFISEISFWFYLSFFGLIIFAIAFRYIHMKRLTLQSYYFQERTLRFYQFFDYLLLLVIIALSFVTLATLFIIMSISWN